MAALLREVELPAPGGRLVIAARAFPRHLMGQEWHATWTEAALIPEVPAACDPVPGDVLFPEIVATSTARSGESHVTVGCVLVRRFRLEDLALRRLMVLGVSPCAELWFPLEGGSLPMPLSPGIWSLSDLARAYKVPLRDVPRLAVELVQAGALRLA